MKTQAFVIMFGIILALQTASFFLIIRGYNKLYSLLEEMANSLSPKNILRKVQK